MSKRIEQYDEVRKYILEIRDELKTSTEAVARSKKKFGKTPSQSVINRWLAVAGCPFHHGWGEEIKSKARALHEEGMDYGEIERHFTTELGGNPPSRSSIIQWCGGRVKLGCVKLGKKSPEYKVQNALALFELKLWEAPDALIAEYESLGHTLSHADALHWVMKIYSLAGKYPTIDDHGPVRSEVNLHIYDRSRKSKAA